MEIFTTERLRARTLTLDDAQACLELYGDPDVTRYVISDGITIDDIEIIRHQLTDGMLAPREDARLGIWALEPREGGEMLGTVALIPVEGAPHEIETGWHLRPSAWGKGYAFESGVALLRYGFDEAGLDRILALARVGNVRSLRACARIGMARGDDRVYQGDLHACFMAERTTWSPPG